MKAQEWQIFLIDTNIQNLPDNSEIYTAWN